MNQSKVEEAISDKHTCGEISGSLRDVATEVLGFKAKAGADPLTETVVKERKRLQQLSRDLYEKAREAGSTEDARVFLKQSRQASREHRKLVRRSTNEQWRGVCERLEQADAVNNQGVFWKEMRNIKLWGAPVAKAVRFAPEDLREHFSKIGKEINETEEAILNSVEQTVATAWDMDNPPTWDEVNKGINGMRESAPGPDLITVSLIKKGGVLLRQKVTELVR